MTSTRQRFSPVMSDVGDRALSPTLSASSRATSSLPTDLSDVSSIDGEDFEVIEAPSPEHAAAFSPQQTPLMDSFDDLGEAQWSRSPLLKPSEGDQPIFPLSPIITPMTASDALMMRNSWASIEQRDATSESMSSSQLRFPDPLDSSFQFTQQDSDEEADATIAEEKAMPSASPTVPRLRERSTSTSTLNARAANVVNALLNDDDEETKALPPIQQNLLLHLIKTMSRETATTLFCLMLVGVPVMFNWLYYAHTTVGPAIITPNSGINAFGRPTPIVSSLPLNTQAGKALLMLSPKRNNALMVLPSSGAGGMPQSKSSSYLQAYRTSSAPTAIVPESKSLIVRQKTSLALHASKKLSRRLHRSSRNAKLLMKHLPKNDWKAWMHAAHEFAKPVVVVIVNDARRFEDNARQSWHHYTSRQTWDTFNDHFRSTYEDFKRHAYRASKSTKWQWDAFYQATYKTAAMAGQMIYEDMLVMKRTVSDAFANIVEWRQIDWHTWMMPAIRRWQAFVELFRKDLYKAHAQAVKVRKQAGQGWHAAYGKATLFAHDVYASASLRDEDVEQNAALAYRRLTLQRREQKYQARRQHFDDDDDGSDLSEQVVEAARRAYENVVLHAGRSRLRLEDAWSEWTGCGKCNADMKAADASVTKQMQNLYKRSQRTTKRSLRRTLRKGKRLRRKMMKSNTLKRLAFT